MPDENILAGMTGEQADADIARREAKVERLEATLRTAKDNLKAARSERRHLEEPTRTPPALTAVDFDRALNASAGTAKGSGEAGI
jgi:multidrug resistance efflux pump